MAHDHFGRLLVVLVILFVEAGAADSAVTRLIAGLLLFAALVLAVQSSGARNFRWASRLMACGLVAVGGVALAPFDSSTARGWGSICAGMVALGALAAVLGRVLRHETVGPQTLAGALCAYLLIGFVFASVYSAGDHLGSAPVFGQPVGQDAYSYFSLITLTTTGYGDLTPATDVARRVAAMEAMIGQIYLAVTVARLVALYRPRRAQAATRESTDGE